MGKGCNSILVTFFSVSSRVAGTLPSPRYISNARSNLCTCEDLKCDFCVYDKRVRKLFFPSFVSNSMLYVTNMREKMWFDVREGCSSEAVHNMHVEEEGQDFEEREQNAVVVEVGF